MNINQFRFLSDSNKNKGNVINHSKRIEIGDSVWIGCRATILKGSVIPSGSIIAASSTITGIMAQEGCVFTTGGKIIKDSVTWVK